MQYKKHKVSILFTARMTWHASVTAPSDTGKILQWCDDTVRYWFDLQPWKIQLGSTKSQVDVFAEVSLLLHTSLNFHVLFKNIKHMTPSPTEKQPCKSLICRVKGFHKVKITVAHQWQRQAVLADGYTAESANFVQDTGGHQEQSSQEVCQGELHQEVHLKTNMHKGCCLCA